ncbi:MAG: NERD domain-containing protein [Bacteroides sp.]|nr:NERD domain-containing protein [Eubacterium sp.]MCM1417692.1 NERD domain-containing protein [Roseburia sp.]MCM1461842.1 NERD domain-containing protein [Bacteroides sp.]
MKIYKAKNKNKKRVWGLFALQVVFGTLPAILLVVFVMSVLPIKENTGGENSGVYIAAYISAAAIILCGFAYTILGRKYNILISGLRGEKALYKIAKKHKNAYRIFLNLPIRYNRNRSELDMLMVGEKGVLIVEVKNHSGTISGGDKDERWTQFKHYKDGRSTEGEMKNPLKQLSRQREILKSILRAAGVDVWVDGVVFFSNPFVRLKLNLSANGSYVAAGESELNEFIAGYESPRPLDREKMDKITQILKGLLE